MASLLLPVVGVWALDSGMRTGRAGESWVGNVSSSLVPM